jgi:hypothetical protein
MFASRITKITPGSFASSSSYVDVAAVELLLLLFVVGTDCVLITPDVRVGSASSEIVCASDNQEGVLGSAMVDD